MDFKQSVLSVEWALTTTGQRVTTLNRALNDREPVKSHWFPNSKHPSGRV